MAPFAVGLLIPPGIALIAARLQRGAARFWGAYAAALVVGVIVSLVMGELLQDLPEAIASIVIDSSLVFAASQVAYRLFWKQALAGWMASQRTAARR
jgi:uncharacterized membrane protein